MSDDRGLALSDTLARAMCCANGCTTPDACRAGDPAQLIAIPQAAAIAAREMPRLMCERWQQWQRDTMATETGR